MLAIVIVCDFLFGRGIEGKGPWKDAVLRHKTRLNAELVRMKIMYKVTKKEDLVQFTQSFILKKLIAQSTYSALCPHQSFEVHGA